MKKQLENPIVDVLSLSPDKLKNMKKEDETFHLTRIDRFSQQLTAERDKVTDCSGACAGARSGMPTAASPTRLCM